MLDELLTKQKQLMEAVPHDVRPDAVVKMATGLKIIDVLLRYLNSIGHKPWRPNPLSPIVQQGLLRELGDKVNVLKYVHSTSIGHDLDTGHLDLDIRRMVSTFGIIEEATEHMNSVLSNDAESHRLEELVDILFFWLEQVAMSGFTMDQVVKEYHRKHSENLERYRKAKEGDWSWDRRCKDSL